MKPVQCRKDNLALSGSFNAHAVDVCDNLALSNLFGDPREVDIYFASIVEPQEIVVRVSYDLSDRLLVFGCFRDWRNKIILLLTLFEDLKISRA